MNRTRSAIVAITSLLASCSLVTGYRDLEFTPAGSEAGLDAGRDARSRDGDAPDRPSFPDAMRDAFDPDVPARDMAIDAIVRPDAADMAVVTPCGVCPAAPVCAVATCTPDGCSTALLAAGVACDDGDACTEGTRCDGEGRCVGGTSCPDDGDLCTEEVCTPAGCGATARIDNFPCGATSDYVCCRGRCVNTVIDAQNCGACGATCVGSGCVTGGCSRTCGTPTQCVPAMAPLCVVASCDFASGCTFTPTVGFCLIDGACYAHNDVLPDNPCMRCDVTLDSTRWTPTPSGMPCDDGLACSTSEECDGAGRCGGGIDACGETGECAVAVCVEGATRCSPQATPDGSACASGSGVCCEGACMTDRAFCEGD